MATYQSRTKLVGNGCENDCCAALCYAMLVLCCAVLVGSGCQSLCGDNSPAIVAKQLLLSLVKPVSPLACVEIEACIVLVRNQKRTFSIERMFGLVKCK